jgi:hypothetical protein
MALDFGLGNVCYLLVEMWISLEDRDKRSILYAGAPQYSLNTIQLYTALYIRVASEAYHGAVL